MGEVSDVEMQAGSRIPGGAVVQKPAVFNGEFYDPLDQPMAFKGASGNVEYHGGTKIDTDEVYAKMFWQGKNDRTKGDLRQAMRENIHQSDKDGYLRLAVDSQTEGISETDKLKLSAYRQEAKSIGYGVGKFVRNRATGIASAPVRKVSSAR